MFIEKLLSRTLLNSFLILKKTSGPFLKSRNFIIIVQVINKYFSYGEIF